MQRCFLDDLKASQYSFEGSLTSIKLDKQIIGRFEVNVGVFGGGRDKRMFGLL